jgi:methylenetetrahydrofolate reductase (NADPH)
MAALLERPRLEILPVAGVFDELAWLPHGATVTVTASPRQGAEATVDTCERLVGLGLRPVPHLAARQFADAAQLSVALARLERAGVDDLFVVGGGPPPPGGAGRGPPRGGAARPPAV